MIRNATRQPTVSTRTPPTIGPRTVEGRGRRRPDAERAGPLLALERVRDERQRAGDEQRAGRALEQAEDDQQLERRREAAQRGRHAEPGQADREDPAPAVVVGQGAGQDEQRGQDREVAADDVGLALEDAEERGRQLLADLLGSATFTIVPSRKTAPDPMIVATSVQRWRVVMRSRARCRGVAEVGRRGSVAARAVRGNGRGRLSRRCPDPWRSSAPVSSFPRWPSSTPACSAATGRAAAARRDPADRLVPRRRGRLPALGGDGRRALRRRSAPRSSRSSSATGATPTIAAAAQAIGEADLVYLSGGKPAHLLDVLDGSAGRPGAASTRTHAGRGPRRLLGRGDGARRAHASTSGSGCCPWPLRWRPGLGFVAGRVGRAALRRLARAAVGAHRAPGAARVGRARASTRRPRSSAATASWQVHGRSRVTVWRGRHRERYRRARRSGSSGRRRAPTAQVVARL